MGKTRTKLRRSQVTFQFIGKDVARVWGCAVVDVVVQAAEVDSSESGAGVQQDPQPGQLIPRSLLQSAIQNEGFRLFFHVYCSNFNLAQCGQVEG